MCKFDYCSMVIIRLFVCSFVYPLSLLGYLWKFIQWELYGMNGCIYYLEKLGKLVESMKSVCIEYQWRTMGRAIKGGGGTGVMRWRTWGIVSVFFSHYLFLLPSILLISVPPYLRHRLLNIVAFFPRWVSILVMWPHVK